MLSESVYLLVYVKEQGLQTYSSLDTLHDMIRSLDDSKYTSVSQLSTHGALDTTKGALTFVLEVLNSYIQINAKGHQ